MNEKQKRRLKTILNWDRSWFAKKLKDPTLVQTALDALDAYGRCQNLPSVSAGDIQPIATAAHSLNRQVREMAVQMLVILGLDWRCACDVLLGLVSHSNGQLRWTAITQVPYWVSYQRESFPQDFIVEFLRRGMKDKVPKNRQFAYEGVRTFFRPDLLPEIRGALITETQKEIIDGLKEIEPFLARGFYMVPYAGPARTDTEMRVFLQDGTLLESEKFPLGLPMADVQAIAENIRRKPLSELKAAQSAFEAKLVADEVARIARVKDTRCPCCGSTDEWDGEKCFECAYRTVDGPLPQSK